MSFQIVFLILLHIVDLCCLRYYQCQQSSLTVRKAGGKARTRFLPRLRCTITSFSEGLTLKICTYAKGRYVNNKYARCRRSNRNSNDSLRHLTLSCTSPFPNFAGCWRRPRCSRPSGRACTYSSAPSSCTGRQYAPQQSSRSSQSYAPAANTAATTATRTSAATAVTPAPKAKDLGRRRCHCARTRRHRRHQGMGTKLQKFSGNPSSTHEPAEAAAASTAETAIAGAAAGRKST